MLLSLWGLQGSMRLNYATEIPTLGRSTGIEHQITGITTRLLPMPSVEKKGREASSAA